MFTTTGVSKAGLVILAVTLGWSTGANAQGSARAVSGARAATAQQRADAARQHATELARAGGWAYKAGAVARAEREAQAQTTGGEAEPVAQSAEQAAALARLEELRQAGGWAYKTGAVARAEREVQALAAPRPTSICGVEKISFGF